MKRLNLIISAVLTLAATAASAQVTFYDDIQPIFAEHCVRCHYPDSAAPMSLETFEQVRPWASSIEQEVLDRRMPPWFAAPDVGQFINDARLSESDRTAILKWVELGATAGKRPARVPVRVPRAGWKIGEPDLVIEMPEPFEVPATGEVDYVYVRLTLPNARDRWVQAVEVIPGSPAVIHHIDVFLCPENCEEFLDLELGVPSFLPRNLPPEPAAQTETGEFFGLDIELLYSYLPGGDPWVLPPGRGRLLPARGEVLLNLHYTPNGTGVLDRSRFGVVFTDEPPLQRVLTLGVDNESLWIPAGAAAHGASARVTATRDMELLALTPHMHLRGRSFSFEAKFPNGDRRLLLNVPAWDFNWQLTYVLSEPIALLEGTEILCSAVFDNSRGNRFNPNARQNVPWGRQVTDEMMTAWIEVAFPVDAEPLTLFTQSDR